jgi:YfiR/HmsC-like
MEFLSPLKRLGRRGMTVSLVAPLAAAHLFLAVLPGPLPAAPPSPNEYALKSVFLYNFCRFIDWPKSAFASPQQPFVIGVIGRDPFGPMLNEAVAGETYHDRPIRIEHYRNPSQIGNCQLLFVSASASAEIDRILAAVAHKDVVTVGETEEFLDHGGMIALTTRRNRIRLSINTSAVRAAQMEVSSKLLRIAELRP